MSRERDSEVVYELVSSKYKIAERNRLAKYRFLTSSENVNNLSSKHRGSEPSLAQTEKADVKPVDLSVPGTPVSSRYLESFGKFRRNRGDMETDSEGENDDEQEDSKSKSVFHSALQESLKQFTSDMEKLKKDISSHDVSDSTTNGKESRKTVKKEEESPKKQDETETLPIKEPPAITKIERYFRESARRGSLTRDFTEVVQTFDPKIARDPENTSKPGTPVSSKLIKAEKVSSKKLQPFTENIKKLDALKSPEMVKQTEDASKRISDVPPEKPKRVHPIPLTPPSTPIIINVESPSPVNTPLDPKDFPPISSAGIKDVKKDKEILIIIEKKLVEDEVKHDDEKVKVIEPTTSKLDSKTVVGAKKPINAVETPIVAAIAAKEKSVKSSQGQQKTEAKVEKSIPEKKSSKDSADDDKPKSVEQLENNKSSDETSDDFKQLPRKLSVPGTPVDSRKLFKTSSADDDSDLDSDIEIIDSTEIKDLAKELVDKIETLVQKSVDEKELKVKEQAKIEAEKLSESNKIALSPKVDQNKEDKDDKLLIIYEDNSKIKSYFEQSEKEKQTFQRTFSEIENFNEPPMDVKEKVEKYFKESEDKKSLTRGFSEAVNYLEPVNIEELFKPGTPISSKVVENLKVAGVLEEEKEVDPVVIQGIEAFQKAHDAIHQNPRPEFKVHEYFEESKTRHTLQRDFSEVFGEIGGTPRPAADNPDIKKFFEESEQQKSFRRQFSEAVQSFPPRIKDIIPDEQPPLHVQRSSRAASVFSAPDPTEINLENPAIARKHGKKYGIDKYFAASLYRTAYHRSKNQRRGSEPDHRFAILEDEYVFGENDVLRSQVFQDDDQTPIHPIHHKHAPNDGNDEDFDQQNVQFWRDFLKPYNLNLPNDIVMRDELIEKYTKYTLE